MRLLLNEWRKFLDEAKIAPEWKIQMSLQNEYLNDEPAMKWVRDTVANEELKALTVNDLAQEVGQLFLTLDEPLGGGPYDPNHDYAKDARALAKEIAERDVDALQARLAKKLKADAAKAAFIDRRGSKRSTS